MAATLVLQAARFGDLVQTKRLLLSLATRGEVHLAVDESLVPLAHLLYPFAEIHGLSVHGSPAGGGLEKNFKVLSRWKSTAFDAVFNCNFSGLTAALCRVFNPEIVQGYRPESGGVMRSPWARLGFRLSEKRSLSPLNLVDFWAHFMEAPLSPSAVNPVAISGGQGLGVVLAGRESRRSLPIPVLAEITRVAFGALGGPRVRLLGSVSEQSAARRLLRHLPARMLDRVEDMSGKTDWPALMDAVRGLDALITPDTGIMHLGAHVGAPVLAFFLSSAWQHETGPYGEGHHVWQASRQCSPCLESSSCPYGVVCAVPFSRVEILRSLAAVAERLKSGQSDAADGMPPLPDDMQLWRTELDALGARPALLVGEDTDAGRREEVRAFLAKRLHISAMHYRNDQPPGLFPDMGAWLYDDKDWMLPSGRYC